MFCLLLAQSSGSEYYSCWYPLQFYVVRQLWPVSDLHFTVGYSWFQHPASCQDQFGLYRKLFRCRKSNLQNYFISIIIEQEPGVIDRSLF